MSQYIFRSILTAVSGASCSTDTHTHTDIHYSVQHKLLQNSADTCPVSNVRILGRKKSHTRFTNITQHYTNCLRHYVCWQLCNLHLHQPLYKTGL